MNGLQVFAFIGLPIIVAGAGWAVALLVAPIKRTPKTGTVGALLGPRNHHA